MAGCGWKLDVEGQPASAAPEEPRFSTWEEVLGKNKAGASNGQHGSAGGGSSSGGGGTQGGGVAETAYYSLLGVAPSASQAELKAAYRKLALQLHPDVSSAPDAAQRFAAVAAAFDVLSDPESRMLYDRYGAEGMKGRAGGWESGQAALWGVRRGRAGRRWRGGGRVDWSTE